MLDLQYLCEHADRVQENCRNRARPSTSERSSNWRENAAS